MLARFLTGEVLLGVLLFGVLFEGVVFGVLVDFGEASLCLFCWLCEVSLLLALSHAPSVVSNKFSNTIN